MEKREILSVTVSIILCAVVISFIDGEIRAPFLLSALAISAVIILISVCSKKLTAGNIDVGIKLKIWEFQRYGLAAKQKFRSPFPIGLLLPLILVIISNGMLKFLAFLQFESKALPAKAVKKYGLRRFSGIMEWDDALIVFYSVLPLMILAIAASFFDSAFFNSLSRYSMFYVISNLIPISQLDGTKLFFGSRPLFVFTWILAVISSFFAFF